LLRRLAPKKDPKVFHYRGNPENAKKKAL